MITTEQARREVDPLHLAKRGYELIEKRDYVHVAAVLGNGQRTARWSRRKRDGKWFMSNAWARANLSRPLTYVEVAAVERLLADQTTTSSASGSP